MKDNPKQLQDFVDYSQEVKLVQSKLARSILVILSFLFLGLGILGVFLPVLPTTPFILLSGFLYARSSHKFYNWLMNHRHLGPPLREWKDGGRIPRKAKALAVTMIIVTIPISMAVVPLMAVRVFLGLIGVTVVAFIISRPS